MTYNNMHTHLQTHFMNGMNTFAFLDSAVTHILLTVFIFTYPEESEMFEDDFPPLLDF